jgi:glycerate kinase
MQLQHPAPIGFRLSLEQTDVARILVIPDSFKGSASSIEVARAVTNGWHSVRPDDEITSIAFGDGGEGTLDAIESSVADCLRIPITVQAANGLEHQSHWLLINGNIAVIEMAILCGITTIDKLDPLGSHSYGLGQAIKAALDDDRVKEILVAVGGSASTDGGVGAMTALGIDFKDIKGAPLALGGKSLIDIASIDFGNRESALAKRIKVLVDVQSPMTGADGAAFVFGPQKGASATDIELLNRGLENFLTVTGSSDAGGYGAAGGVSGGLATLLGAEIVSGVATLAEITEFLAQLDTTDYVITGEGSFDSQSFSGKVVGYVLEQAKIRSIESLVVCGINKNCADPRVISLVELAPSVDAALEDSEHWLEVAGAELARRFRKHI